MFQYLVHYQDGATETVDVRYQWGVAHWLQAEAKGLKEAALAWAAPAGGDDGKEAVLYALQWNNPHPDRSIASIDLRYDPKVGNRYGNPIVLGISTATRQK